jgi:hypothetical protein
MIIDKGVMTGEVVTFKLTSGEEIVAKLVDDGPMHYRLSRPMVIAMGPNGPGLMPYLFTVNPEKEVKLNKGTVTVAEATDAVFAKQFLEQTSGIKLA